MTEPTDAGPPQRSDRSPGAVDTWCSAALKLGYYSRDIDLEILHQSLAVLGDEVQQNVFLALQQVIERLGTSDDERELCRALLPDYDLPDMREEKARDVKALRSYADQAIAMANPIRTLYELGTTLGDYYLQKQVRRKAPDDSAVWQSVRCLPAWCLERSPSLWELAKSAGKRPNLEQALKDIVQSSELRPEEKVSRRRVASRKPPPKYVATPERHVVLRFVSVASHSLKQIPNSVAASNAGTGWDSATESRNRWIYEKCKECVPYKQIIRELAAKATVERWNPIDTVNGIKAAATAYIKRHALKPLPPRQPGRPRTRN